MDMLLALWLPILVCAIVLFFASFLAWAVLPHHNPDWKKLPDEDRFFAFIKEQNIAPGEYLFPLIDPKQMKDPAMVERYSAGPWGIVNLWPSKPSMGKNMALTVLTFLVVSFFIAYIAAAALPRGASFTEVFQIVAVAAILAYTAGSICREIWFTRPLRAKVMDFIDGVAYGIITGVIFGLLWPAAASVAEQLPAVGG